MLNTGLKFKEGYKVRVKSSEWYEANKSKDGWVSDKHSIVSFYERQKGFLGKVVTIKTVRENGTYFIAEDGGKDGWDDFMFEDVGLIWTRFKVGDRVKVEKLPVCMFDPYGCLNEYKEWEGKIVTIESVDEGRMEYYVKENNLLWNDRDFVGKVDDDGNVIESTTLRGMVSGSHSCKDKSASDDDSDENRDSVRRYKVGDIVLIRPFSWCSKRIRPDENCIRIKEGDREYFYFSPFMGEYCGKVVTIANVVEADGVLLYECRHEGKRIDCYLVGSLFERKVVGKDSGKSPVESESSGEEREMESLQDKFAKFKYKEGDKVRVKPREWFDRYEIHDGRICCDDWGSADGVHGVRFYTAILEHCGEVVEISGLSIGRARGVHIYSAKGIGYTFAEEFFEDEVVERKSVEVGGEHYQMPIQPIEFIMANGIPFCEGNVIKYVCRHRRKNGVEDIRKAIHYLEIILEKEYGVKAKG